MYCFDVLELSFLSKIELVAGERGLNHSIFWVHIAEYAQTESELIPILKPDDFVIIKGNYLQGNPNNLYDFVNLAISLKLSGVLVFKSEICNSIPQDVIDIANENQLPIFFLDEPGTLAVEIQYYMLKIISSETEKIKPYDKIIKDIYYGNVENSQLRIKRSQFMGYDLARKHCGVIITFYDKDSLTEITPDMKTTECCIANIDRYNDGKSLYMKDDSRIVALIPTIDNSNKGIIDLGNRIIREIDAKNYNGVIITFSIGQGKTDVNLFKESIKEAEEISEIMYLQHKFNMVQTFCDMYAFLLLYEIRNDEKTKAMLNRVFRPLIDYDNHHGGNLVNVLKCYLDMELNIAQTAKKLFIHRNTLIYQTKKIEELTNLSFDNHDDVFQYKMACYIKEFIDNDRNDCS